MLVGGVVRISLVLMFCTCLQFTLGLFNIKNWFNIFFYFYTPHICAPSPPLQSKVFAQTQWRKCRWWVSLYAFFGVDILHLFSVHTFWYIYYYYTPPPAYTPNHRTIRFWRWRAWLDKEMLVGGVVRTHEQPPLTHQPIPTQPRIKVSSLTSIVLQLQRS